MRGKEECIGIKGVQDEVAGIAMMGCNYQFNQLQKRYIEVVRGGLSKN